jgi:hypothetical protein
VRHGSVGIQPGAALGDHPSSLDRNSGVDEVACPDLAQSRVLRQLLRPEAEGQVGQLVDDHLGPRDADRRGDRIGVEGVEHGRRDAGAVQPRRALGGPGRPGDLVADLDQHLDERSADGAGGAGHEDAHIPIVDEEPGLLAGPGSRAERQRRRVCAAVGPVFPDAGTLAEPSRLVFRRLPACRESDGPGTRVPVR